MRKGRNKAAVGKEGGIQVEQRREPGGQGRVRGDTMRKGNIWKKREETKKAFGEAGPPYLG
jgi:hypothetical protein